MWVSRVIVVNPIDQMYVGIELTTVCLRYTPPNKTQKQQLFLPHLLVIAIIAIQFMIVFF